MSVTPSYKQYGRFDEYPIVRKYKLVHHEILPTYGSMEVQRFRLRLTHSIKSK